MPDPTNDTTQASGQNTSQATDHNAQGDNEDYKALYEQERQAKAEMLKDVMKKKARLAKYEGIDPEEHNALKEAQLKREHEELAKEKDVDKIRTTIEAAAAKRIAEAEEGKNKYLGELKQEKINNKLMESAIKYGAFNADDVVQLTKAKIALDGDMKPFVLDGDGTAKLNESGKEMTIDEFVLLFLKDRPHLAQKQTQPGSGSGPSASRNGREKWTPEKVKKLSNEEYRKNKTEIKADLYGSG